MHNLLFFPEKGMVHLHKACPDFVKHSILSEETRIQPHTPYNQLVQGKSERLKGFCRMKLKTVWPITVHLLVSPPEGFSIFRVTGPNKPLSLREASLSGHFRTQVFRSASGRFTS